MGSCSTCVRRAAASASIPSSTRTCSRTRGLDTYEANVALGYGEDERDYTVAAQMLGALGVSRVALLSNNPDKAAAAAGDSGSPWSRRVPTGVHLSDANAHYLATKAVRGAHTLDLRVQP